jgi:hypothetical protein
MCDHRLRDVDPYPLGSTILLASRIRGSYQAFFLKWQIVQLTKVCKQMIFRHCLDSA